MTTNENVEKIKALFLNKVKGLEWHYFDIRINEIMENIKKNVFTKTEDFDDFLNNITKDGNDYKYNREDKDVKTIVSSLLAYINNDHDLLRQIMKRIFDTNENNILNDSEADKGKMGKFNEKDRVYRNKIYRKKIRRGFRSDKDNVVILAEGDSWFEFPRICLKIDMVKDIIDHLIDDKKIAVYSMAAGGDWLSNIMYSGEYISELPKISPDVFLISGGGNDMVGDNRLATMVRNPLHEGKLDLTKPENSKYKTLLDKRTENSNDDFNKKYTNGLQFINEEFFLFIDVCMIQYFLFFMNFKGLKKYEKMIFITQGYDFAIPSDKRNGFLISFQRLMNKVMDTGKWLYHPLCMKGIINKEVQEAIVYTMIYEFNEMLIQLAELKQFPNVFHIDCRGVAKNKDGWFDELHLTSKKYNKIAKTYKECIKDNLRMKNNRPGKKVYRVA